MNWFAYRLPGATTPVSGSSERLIGGIGDNGFVIAPFDGDERGILTIPADNLCEGCLDAPGLFVQTGNCDESPYPFPENSTTRDEHQSMVNSVIKAIKERVISKCVISRVKIENQQTDLRESFEAMCSEYPDAFIFIFHAPQSGTWIGASPEILLNKRGNILTTMALAGTRKSGTEGGWDNKNIGEQRIVTDFIVDIMRKKGFQPKVKPDVTKHAGPVEHIMTNIEVDLPEYTNNEESSQIAHAIASDLSPTPALCGFPRQTALQLIENTERHCRGYYGGFCGPVLLDGDMSLYVNLRSARIEPKRVAIFVGGGIVEDSEAAAEWEETERKAETMGKLKIKISK